MLLCVHIVIGGGPHCLHGACHIKEAAHRVVVHLARRALVNVDLGAVARERTEPGALLVVSKVLPSVHPDFVVPERGGQGEGERCAYRLRATGRRQLWRDARDKTCPAPAMRPRPKATAQMRYTDSPIKVEAALFDRVLRDGRKHCRGRDALHGDPLHARKGVKGEEGCVAAALTGYGRSYCINLSGL